MSVLIASAAPTQPRAERQTLEPIREIGTIWSAETARAARSPRTVILVGLYFFFSAVTLLVVGWLTRSAQDLAGAQLGEAASEQARGAKAWILSALFSEDAGLIRALSDLPFVIPALFKITLFFLPAYVALMGFDQLSGELEHRSLRYLAIRARRSSILVGKFLAQATVLVSMILVIDALVFAFAKVTHPDFALGTLIGALLKFWVAAAVFSVAYVALTTLCSGLFRTPAVSLLFNLAALFGFWLVAAIGRWAQARQTPLLGAVQFLSPSTYSTNLLHPEALPFLGATAAYVIFTAVFLSGGYAMLRTRDV